MELDGIDPKAFEGWKINLQRERIEKPRSLRDPSPSPFREYVVLRGILTVESPRFTLTAEELEDGEFLIVQIVWWNRPAT